MVRWFKIPGLALLSGGLLFLAAVPAPHAATSSTVDILSNDAAADNVDIGSVKPQANRERSKPLPGGNPLWSVPLSVLTATQARPIFSASRRPAQRAVAPVEESAMAPPPPKAAEPERLSLALIGAVIGDSDAIAVLFDRNSQKIVRLRQGDTHDGWVLSLVQGREVTLKKADRTEVIELKSADITPVTPVLPGPTAIGAGVLDTNYAPFQPRSTPKNGESDGL